MAQTKTIMTAQGTTGPGPQHTFHAEEYVRGFVVSVGGVAAAVSAAVNIEVSADGGNTWAVRMAFSVSGTSTLTAPVINSDVDLCQPYSLIRADVTSLTGGGFVTVAVTAAYSAPAKGQS